MRSARPAWGTAVAPGATRRPAPNHGAIASAPPVPLPPSNLGLVPPGAAVPQRLTPDSLLALGRTVGNRAVARLVGGAAPAAVQRTLPEGATVRKLDDEDAALSAVGDDVDAYNLLAAGDPRTASEFRPLFAALRKVERALYRWFDAVSRAHTSFAKVPATGPLKVFLKDVDREHAELIDRSKGIEDLVPVDTSSLGAFPGGEPALLTLWQDIVQDRGKIHVRGTDAYRKRVLAELARLLDTDTGRRLLRLLNARQGPEPEGSVEERRTKGWMTDIWIGDRLEDLPEDVRRLSKSLEEPTESKAQPLGAKSKDDFAALMGATEEPVDDTETEETYPTVTGPSELFKVREAAWGGLQGFRFGGKRYRFRGPSTGAFVTSLESDPEESGLASAAGHEILDPSFVTLGHELGHAANMRTGAATASGLDMPDSPTLTAALAGVSVNDARIFWHDPEEVLNIHNVENSLRSDAGLSARGSHAGPDTALRVRRWAQLRAILTATCDPAVDSSWEAVPEFQDIYFRIKDIGGMYGKPKWNDVADDTRFAAYQERVTAFAATWNTTRLVQWKKERVAEARKAMVEAYAATWSASAETEREYKALVARATTQLDAVTALGSRDWDTLVDDLKTFTKKVQGKWFV